MNKRLFRLQERKKAVIKHSEGLLEAADAEDRDLTAEETTALETDETELQEIGVKMEYEQSLATHQDFSPMDGFELDPPTISNPKPSFEDDPKKGFKSPQEFFSAVMHASQSAGLLDDRLRLLSGKGFSATAGSDEAGTYADPYGGFLVPTGFLPNLLTRSSDADPTAGRTTVIPMATPRVDIPARTDTSHASSVSGGLITYRRSETAAVTTTRMTLEQVSLVAHPLMGLTYTTEELLSDSAVSFVALLEAGFRDEFASRIIREKITGTGVGEMEGVINTPALVSVTAETAQDADSIVYENVIKMRARCWRYDNAIWLYNHDALPQLMQMVQVIGTSGVPMWQSSAREGEPNMLLGRPAFANEYMPTLGDAGDILLGDWSQYLEGSYQPMQSAESMHVRFANNERTFRFTMRNDGRCWWRAALTPAVSSTTLSPFVATAARA